jgi:hypothetical protein
VTSQAIQQKVAAKRPATGTDLKATKTNNIDAKTSEGK